MTHLKADAWVDGSFKGGACGAGVVLQVEGITADIEMSARVTENPFISLESSGGELAATMLALEVCLKLGVTSVRVFHDYEGISCWASGIWPKKRAAAKLYGELLDKVAQTATIQFIKVRSHSGISLNKRADYLAKRGVRQ